MYDMNKSFSLKGKNILITGAGSGIGRSTAIIASQMGATVILVDINEEGMKETLSRFDKQNAGHSYYVVNLMDSKEVESLVEDVVCLDGLVNNVGISNTRPLHLIREEDFNLVVGLNTKAPMVLTNLLYKKKKFNNGL